LKIKIGSPANPSPRRVLGCHLKPSNVVECGTELMMVIGDKGGYMKNWVYTNTPICISLKTFELTYLNPDEKYHLYEQVGEAEFRPIYE
jgi:hypothetical protein